MICWRRSHQPGALYDGAALEMSDTVVLTIRLPTEVKERLDRLASDSALSSSRLATDAIVGFLDEQERARGKIREGMADLAAGRVVPHEEVARWLESWRREDEFPHPEMRLIWTARAITDLAEIRSFIGRHDPRAATATATRITRAVARLWDHPVLGRSGREPAPASW